MTERQASAPTPIVDDPSEPGLHRPGYVGRRRHTRRVRQRAEWVAGRSRKRMLRTAVLCTGVLLLMAVGLYLGLSRQDTQLPGVTGFSLVGPSGTV